MPDYSKSPKAGLFQVPLRPETFGFVRNLDLFEVWVCAKFRFIRLHRFGVLVHRDARTALRSASIYIILLYYKKNSPPSPPCQESMARGLERSAVRRSERCRISTVDTPVLIFDTFRESE